MLQDILGDPERIKLATSLEPDVFEYMYGKFVAEMEAWANEPQYADDGASIDDSGLIDKKSSLLLTCMRKSTGQSFDLLTYLLPMDAYTMGRYIWFADHILRHVLPTADVMTELLRSVKSRSEFESLVPDSTVMLGNIKTIRKGPAVPRNDNLDSLEAIREFADRLKNHAAFRKRLHYLNTLLPPLRSNVLTGVDGLILWLGKVFEKETNNMAMLADSPIDIGRWSEGMLKHDTPDAERLTVLANTTYQGIARRYPGINFVVKKRETGRQVPEKQAPRGACQARAGNVGRLAHNQGALRWSRRRVQERAHGGYGHCQSVIAVGWGSPGSHT